MLHAKAGDLPALVHTHPNETLRDAIEILREYGVSQMPVVQAEPPVVAGRGRRGRCPNGRCSRRCSRARRTLADSVEHHMEAALPLVGAGEPVATARHELETSDAVLVIEDGNPVGVLTRADLLTFLAD